MSHFPETHQIKLHTDRLYRSLEGRSEGEGE